MPTSPAIRPGRKIVVLMQAEMTGRGTASGKPRARKHSRRLENRLALHSAARDTWKQRSAWIVVLLVSDLVSALSRGDGME